MSYECDNDNHDIGCQCPGLPIPIRRRDEPVTAGEIEAGLRRLGWDDSALGPDMLACLEDIARGLNEMRSADAQDHDQ